MDDRRRDPHGGEGLGDRVALAQQQAHGQEGVVDPADRGQVDEGRAEDQPGRRVLRGELGDHRGAQALAEVQESLLRHAGVGHQEVPRRAHVERQAGLARAPGVPAVPAVVEQQDRQPLGVQRPRQRGAQPTVPAVAVGDEDRGGVRSRSGQVPGSEVQAVVGGEGDVAGTGEDGARGPHRTVVGQVDQGALERPQQAHQESQQHHDGHDAAERPPSR